MLCVCALDVMSRYICCVSAAMWIGTSAHMLFRFGIHTFIHAYVPCDFASIYLLLPHFLRLWALWSCIVKTLSDSHPYTILSHLQVLFLLLSFSLSLSPLLQRNKGKKVCWCESASLCINLPVYRMYFYWTLNVIYPHTHSTAIANYH